MLVENPAETLVFSLKGSNATVSTITNSPTVMGLNWIAQQEAMHTFSMGNQQGPTNAGPSGSNAPLFDFTPPAQPINFNPFANNPPPTVTGGPGTTSGGPSQPPAGDLLPPSQPTPPQQTQQQQQQTPPTISASISGTPQEGQSITANLSGNQSGDIISYAWYTSADGFTTPIATTQIYQIQESDEGFQLKLVITDVSLGGTTTSESFVTVQDAADTPIIGSSASAGATTENVAIVLGGLTLQPGDPNP